MNIAFSPLTKFPKTEESLFLQAQLLSGRCLGELAVKAGMDIPCNLKYEKGWIGKLIEFWLGGACSSMSGPDFPNLGIELKTIPIKNGNSSEPTFICNESLVKGLDMTWKNSYIYNKIRRILWMPILYNRKNILLSKLTVGNYLLWSPNKEENHLLKSDWEELMDLVFLQNTTHSIPYYGEILQLIPNKSGTKKLLTSASRNYSNPSFNISKRFYFRKRFTSKIFKNHIF